MINVVVRPYRKIIGANELLAVDIDAVQTISITPCIRLRCILHRRKLELILL